MRLLGTEEGRLKAYWPLTLNVGSEITDMTGRHVAKMTDVKWTAPNNPKNSDMKDTSIPSSPYWRALLWGSLSTTPTGPYGKSAAKTVRPPSSRCTTARIPTFWAGFPGAAAAYDVGRSTPGEIPYILPGPRTDGPATATDRC